MKDALQHVTPGQTLTGFPAGLLNDLIEVARWYRQQRATGGALTRPAFRDRGLVPVRNDTGADRQAYDVVGIGDVWPTPTQNLNGFKNAVHLHVVNPTTTHRHRLAVLWEPTKAGCVGMARLCGHTPVRIQLPSSADDWMPSADIVKPPLQDVSYLTVLPWGSAQILWREPGTGIKWALVNLGPASGIDALRGTLIDPLINGGNAAASVTYNGVNVGITVCDDYLADGQSLPVGTPVRAWWDKSGADKWYAVNARCLP